MFSLDAKNMKLFVFCWLKINLRTSNYNSSYISQQRRLVFRCTGFFTLCSPLWHHLISRNDECIVMQIGESYDIPRKYHAATETRCSTRCIKSFMTRTAGWKYTYIRCYMQFKPIAWFYKLVLHLSMRNEYMKANWQPVHVCRRTLRNGQETFG